MSHNTRRPIGVGGHLLIVAVIIGLGVTGGTLIAYGHVEAFIWGFIAVVLFMSLIALISDAKNQ